MSPRRPFLCQGLVCAERRQQRLREVLAKHALLRGELAETQGRLMVEPGRWLEQCECPPPAWSAGTPSGVNSFLRGPETPLLQPRRPTLLIL